MIPSCQRLTYHAVVLAIAASNAFAGPNPQLLYVVNSDGVTQRREQVVIPEGMEDAVIEAEERLQRQGNENFGALVFRVRAPNGEQLAADTELQVIIATQGNGGYIQERVPAGRTGVYAWDGNRRYELRVRSRGFELWSRKTSFKPGHILIWDDIVVSPLDSKRAGIISGTVWLEGDSELGGIPISADSEEVTETDDQGVFVATGIRPGTVRLSAYKCGYLNLFCQVKLEPGGSAVCDLEGRQERFALVRWAYQPRESRSLGRDATSGRTTISDRGLSRISFAEGFQQSKSGNPDFEIIQNKDKLFIQGTYKKDGGRAGFVEVKGVAFDELLEAPETEYRGSMRELQPGDVLVFRCADLKHFAKIEVLSIAVVSGVYEPN